MKEDRDFARTTITVPMELKKRMKRARALANWSSVACEAFEQKLEELGPIEEISTVEAAIERMKNMKPANDNSDSNSAEAGFEAGQKWAMNEASPQQLSRLEKFKADVGYSWDDHLKTPDGMRGLTECVKPHDEGAGEDFENRHGPSNRGVRRGGPGRGGHGRGGRRHRRGPGHRWHGRKIWRSILEARPEDRNFFPAFANGALDVWKQVKDKL
jgi:hypothetical protein